MAQTRARQNRGTELSRNDPGALPPAGFRGLLSDRDDPPRNAHRFYLVAWQPTLFDEGAVVRLYGRKGGFQQLRTTPFPSLEAAWPFIRATIRRRLCHGYRVVWVATKREPSAAGS